MKKTLWALLDDRMGSVGQARGIIQALDGSFEVSEKKVVYNALAALPNCLRGYSLLGLNKKASSELKAPFPDLILSISRRTLPLARHIKKLSDGKSKIVQLMYPGKCGLQDLDLIIVPEHDRARDGSDAFLRITGCPHRVTEEALKEAGQKWRPAFAHLPPPLTAVIVGGAIKNKPFSAENAKALAEEVKILKGKIGGSLLLTTSRRTGRAAEKIITELLKDIPAYTYLWGDEKENPIMGFWALGEQIIVTGDTVSMCSESCGSGKPVLIFRGRNWLTPKHERFTDSLIAGGYATPLEDREALSFKPKRRLNPAQEIAAKIKTLV